MQSARGDAVTLNREKSGDSRGNMHLSLWACHLWPRWISINLYPSPLGPSRQIYRPCCKRSPVPPRGAVFRTSDLHKVTGRRRIEIKKSIVFSCFFKQQKIRCPNLQWETDCAAVLFRHKVELLEVELVHTLRIARVIAINLFSSQSSRRPQ